MKYWIECIESSADDHGIKMTREQVELLAKDVEMGHEMFGEAHGWEHIPNPIQLENNRLEKALKREREKIICKECSGSGRITTYGPSHNCSSECYKCRGSGFIYN